jgi:ATP-dependent Lhr-like helicase
MRSKKLLEGVAGYPDFPILLETWRGCLQDEFDLPSLKLVLSELAQGQIRRSEVHTDFPSPFAENISWIQTNQHIYESDAVPGSGMSTVQGEVIRQILYSSRLRPRIAAELSAELQLKLQRTVPGYAPAPAEELLDWVKERLILADPEWIELLEAVMRDHRLDSEDIGDRIADKLIRYRLPGAEFWVVSALERMPRILRAFSQGTGREIIDLIAAVEVDEQRFNRGSLAWVRDNLRESEHEAEGTTPLLSSLVGEWLRFYGPLPLAWISRCLGLRSPRLEAVLDASVDSGSLIVDHLTRDATELQVCDAENLEILLRLTRKGGRPSFKALNLDHLPLFLAAHQGLVGQAQERQRSTPEDLRRVLEQLFGFPAPVRLWEQELFPARLRPYFGSWLDVLLQGSELQWFGCGKQRISFCFSSDLELFLGSDGSDGGDDLSNLLPSPKGKFAFWDLVDHSGKSPAATTTTIWELVWSGRLSADSFDVLRKAAAGGFRGLPDSTDGSRAKRRPGRRGYDRWRASHPLSGSWYGIEGTAEADPLEEEELARDRVRQLLQRYGILFREILARELPPLQWSRLFRTLRIMELSGEILSGHFFEGIPGLQFISHRALRSLGSDLPQEEIFWVCALDPASPCGMGLEMAGLPARLASNHLVYHGSRLTVVSKGWGKEIDIRVPSQDPSIPRYLRVFGDLLNRDVAPRKSVRVERINGSAARESPYKKSFFSYGFVEEYKGLLLRAGY